MTRLRVLLARLYLQAFRVFEVTHPDILGPFLERENYVYHNLGHLGRIIKNPVASSDNRVGIKLNHIVSPSDIILFHTYSGNLDAKTLPLAQ